MRQLNGRGPLQAEGVCTQVEASSVLEWSPVSLGWEIPGGFTSREDEEWSLGRGGA